MNGKEIGVLKESHKGDVDVICGGPPCDGISGFNRFQNKENPLDDNKNKELIVYVNLVQHLKPRYVLMENLVDLVKFTNSFLGRYALGRLIGMNYQVRMGKMAASAYGLPQFRVLFFLWGHSLLRFVNNYIFFIWYNYPKAFLC